MVPGSDGVFVASPAVHAFVEQALSGVPDHWYSPPPGVVAGPGNSWYLSDTTNIAKLPGDNPPSPTPSASPFVLPPDPGGPIIASPCPSPVVQLNSPPTCH
jgi:hypothetical protein